MQSVFATKYFVNNNTLIEMTDDIYRYALNGKPTHKPIIIIKIVIVIAIVIIIIIIITIIIIAIIIISAMRHNELHNGLVATR